MFKLLLLVILLWVAYEYYKKCTPVIADMRILKDTSMTYQEWNVSVFNPALVKAYQTKRHVKVIRYEDDTNRGRVNDKFEIDKHLLEWMRPLPKVDFE